MKRFIYIIFASFLVASCFDGSNYYEKFTDVTTFEYTQEDYAKLFGSDSTYFDASQGVGIKWNYFAFYHKTFNGMFLGGFQLSYMKPSGNADKPEGYALNPYRVVGPQLSSTNKTYSVFHQSADPSEMPEHDFGFLVPSNGTCTPRHCWVNNSEAVYEALKPGDEFKIVAKGFLGGKETGTVEIKLAADTLVYNWTKFDLAKIGPVDAMDFEIVSSNASVPKFFCMDELVADVNIEY